MPALIPVALRVHQSSLALFGVAHMTQVPIQDLQNVLATRLVLAFIQRDLQGIQQGYNVRLKLWHSYIWTGLVQGATPSGFFAHAWQKASKHLGHESCLRTIIKGQRANSGNGLSVNTLIVPKRVTVR